MTSKEFSLTRYKNFKTNRFPFWMKFDYQGLHTGKGVRKTLISFFTKELGPIGERWQYELKNNIIFIKVDHESDVTLMLLKFGIK